MQLRTVVSLLSLSIPCGFAVLACGDGASSPAEVPDAGTFVPDASAPDTSAPDASAPDTSAPDASDASDAASEADAAPVTALPFATGLGANGAPLADGQIDPHWTVKDLAGAPLTSYVQTDALGYVGYWLAPSATSKFISPFVDTVDPTGSGTFIYTTTFVLGPEVDLSAAALTIRYASDNAMSAITLNGQSAGAIAAGSYSAFETVNVTTPFVRGTNTLAFTVTNSGGPTGVRVELDLTK